MSQQKSSEEIYRELGDLKMAVAVWIYSSSDQSQREQYISALKNLLLPLDSFAPHLENLFHAWDAFAADVEQGDMK